MLANDLTVKRIIENLVEKYKAKFNVELTYQEAFDIVNSQFKNVAYAFNTTQAIQLPRLGTFHILPSKMTDIRVINNYRIRESLGNDIVKVYKSYRKVESSVPANEFDVD